MKKYILLLTLVKKKARVAKLISDKINFRGTKIIRKVNLLIYKTKIYYEQVGLILGIEVWYNIRK